MVMQNKGVAVIIRPLYQRFEVSKIHITGQAHSVQWQRFKKTQFVSDSFTADNEEHDSSLSDDNLEYCSDLKYIRTAHFRDDHISSPVSGPSDNYLLAQLICWLKQRTVVGEIRRRCCSAFPGEQEHRRVEQPMEAPEIWSK